MDVENQTETTGPKTFRSRMVTIVSLGLVCVGGALMVASTHGKTVVENQMSATPVQASLARTLSGQPKYDAVPTKSPSSGLHKPTWKPSAKPVENASKQGAALPKIMNLLETPVVAKAAPAGGAAGSAVSGAVKETGGVPPIGTLAAHPKTATTTTTTTTEASPAIMSATAFDTASATRALQNAAPVKPASGTGGPSGQVHRRCIIASSLCIFTYIHLCIPMSLINTFLSMSHFFYQFFLDFLIFFSSCFVVMSQAPPVAGATGPVLPVDIVVDGADAKGCPTCATDADCAAVGYGPCVSGKCQPKSGTATTVSGPVTPIDTPDGPVFPGDVVSTDATPTKPAAQSGAGAKTAAKPVAATALYAKTTIKKAATPTKSPSSGLHKPTWRPSSKPNESSSSKSGVGAALPRKLSAVPVKVTKDDADPCHDGLSPRCTPPTSKPVEHASKQGASLPRALKQDFLQTTAILKSPEESLSTENLEATKIHAANAQALAAQGGKDEGISTKKVLADQQQETVYAAIAEEKKAAVAGDKKTAPPASLYSTGGKVTNKVKDDADPCHDGLSPRCTPPTSKPVEHASKQAAALPRTLSAVPVKVIKDDADPCHDGLSPRCTPPTSKPVEHASKQAAALPRTLSAVKVIKDDADPCHDGLSPRCTPPTSKPVEHRVQRSLAGSPTKSPSSGLHKPTWKPSSKPNEHRTLTNAHPGDLTTSTAGKGAFAEVGPSKSPSTGIHKPTWKPTQGKPSGKPVEPWKEGVESAHTEMKNSAHTDGEIVKEHSLRRLSGYKAVGSPTKSPSTGIMKPTWKPSSKPQEDRKLKSSKTSSKAASSSSSSVDSKKSSKKTSSSSSSSSDKSSTKKSSGKGGESDDSMPPPPPATDDATPPPPPPSTDDATPPPPPPSTDDATPPPPPPSTDDATPPPPPPSTDDATPPPPPPAPDAPSTSIKTSTKSSSSKTTTTKTSKPLAEKPEGEAPVAANMLLPPAKNSKLSTISKTVVDASTALVAEPAST